MPGLVRKTIQVKGKRRSYKRTIMVRAKPPNHMDGLSTAIFLRKHGKYYGKMQLGIGGAAAAGGLSGWALANAVRSSNPHIYTIGGYAGGAALAGMRAVISAATTNEGRAFMRDYHRLNTTQRRMVRGFGIAANVAGHVGVVGTGAAAYHAYNKLRRG